MSFLNQNPRKYLKWTALQSLVNGLYSHATVAELFILDVSEGLGYVSEAIIIFILVGCWIGLSLAVGLYVFTVINSFTWYRYAFNFERFL